MNPCFAHEEHGQHSHKDPKEGFEINSVAYSTFGIQTLRPRISVPLELPKSALLLSQDESSIYVIRKSRFFRIPVLVKSRSSEQIWIKTDELQPHDEIVVRGVGFLRIAELGSNGNRPEGHGH
jgi:hypothetical protein